MSGVVIRDKFSPITQREQMIDFIFFLERDEVEYLMGKIPSEWDALEFFSNGNVSYYFGFVYEVYDWKETKEMEDFCRRAGDGTAIYQVESGNDAYNLFYATKNEQLLVELFDMMRISFNAFDKDTIYDFADKEDPDEDE